MPHVQPILTELLIRGLRQPFTILQVTDLHMCAMTEEEAAAMPRARYDYIQPRIGLFSGGRPYPPESVLPCFADYAREAGADLILMTGDIMDFPSEANMDLLRNFVADSPVPVLSITGNHDWSYADDYHTPHAEAVHLPRIHAISGVEHGCAVYETDDIVILAIDNSRDAVSTVTASAYLQVLLNAHHADKPVILAMHVPFTADTLVEDCTRVWRRNICLGQGALGEKNDAVMALYNAVAIDAQLAPAAVITGHLHFDHEDVFPNGVPQLVTDIACGGHCRLIRLIPADK